MLIWLAVGFGGAVGSMARHGINRLVQLHWASVRFPVSTVVVNVLGCCVFGILAGLVDSGRLPMRMHWREFVFVGILGGFTTFSTFGFDTITLARAGAHGQAVSNIAVQLVCGIGGLYAGLVLTERVILKP